MKATLTFNLPEDKDEFRMATTGASMYNVLWEMDQWLRSNTKYAPDSMSEDTYNTYQACRDQLRELMSSENINFH